MSRVRTAGETTIIPVLRDDGTVYFHYEAKTLNERLCQWTLGALWFAMFAVIVSAMVWS